MRHISRPSGAVTISPIFGGGVPVSYYAGGFLAGGGYGTAPGHTGEKVAERHRLYYLKVFVGGVPFQAAHPAAGIVESYPFF